MKFQEAGKGKKDTNKSKKLIIHNCDVRRWSVFDSDTISEFGSQ